MEKAQLDTANQLTAISASQSDRLVLEAALAGGLGLAAVVASVFLLVWFGRKVTRDLGGLNDSVRGMADERLPRVVERLRRGDDVDVAAESPPPGHQHHPGGLADRGVVRHRPGRGRLRRRRPGPAAQGSQPGLPEHLHAQPVPAAPAAGDAGLDGAADQRAGRARRPVPPRPPHHPHAPARRGPDHLVGRGARPRLARPGAGGGHPAGRGGRGRGLRPGRRDQRVGRPHRGERGQRRDPPDRRADRERRGVLPAQHQDRGPGRTGGHRPGRRGGGPRPGHVARRARRHQRAAGQPARVRPRRTAISSGCSWSAGWRPGTPSRSRSAGRCTAARWPWS